MLGIKQQHTTAYRPQANGMVERLHRQLKDSLALHLHIEWSIYLSHPLVYEQLGVKNRAVLPPN